MSPCIFMTGASGYIGGQFLHTLSLKHPDYQVIALVRTEEQKEKISKIQPATTFVIGDLDSSEIISEESKKADVVLQLAECDHVGATRSIMEGIVQGGKKGVFVHMSGAASIYESHIAPGARSTRVWSDMEDLSIIQNFDATRWHHATDQLLFNAHQTHGIKSAIVVPTSVYGIGEGIKKLSMGLPMLFEAIKKRGKAFTVNKGEHRMCASHVKDVADILVTFVEEALSPESKTLTWGKDGYYFIESGGYVFSDITAAAAKLMVEKGLIETEEIDAISPEEVEELVLHPWGSVMWGSNMDVTASRLRALGWEPKQPNVFECISEMLPDLLEREMVIPELLLRLSEPGSTVSRSRS